MKKYQIISNDDPKEVEMEVSRLLNEGWQLAGGASVAYKHEHTEGKHSPGHLVYVQAIVKGDI